MDFKDIGFAEILRQHLECRYQTTQLSGVPRILLLTNQLSSPSPIDSCSIDSDVPCARPASVHKSQFKSLASIVLVLTFVHILFELRSCWAEGS